MVGVMLGLELSSNDNACLKRGKDRYVTRLRRELGRPSLPPLRRSGRREAREGRWVGWASPLPRLLCRARSLVAVIARRCFFLGRLFQQSGFCTARFVVWFCLQMVGHRLVADGGDGGGGGDT